MWCLWLTFLLRICGSHIHTHSVQLTPWPNVTSSNEASIYKLKDVTIHPQTNSWKILPSDEIGFHLHLLLHHNKFSFHDTKTTKIILQITIDTNTSNNLLISLSQANKYLTIATSSINNLPISYPKCDNQSPYTQTYATGNITSILSINNTNNRISKATNNTYNSNNLSHILNTSVLTLIIDNHPLDNYMILSSNTALQSCGYIAMTPHISLNIYFAAIHIGHIFNIHSITITHEIYDTTIINTGKIVHTFDNIILLIVISLLCLAFFLCLLDMLHSKLTDGLYRCYGCNRSDQMNSFIIFLYAVCVCNVVTDLYISYECVMYYYRHDKYLSIAILSVLFIIIPYIINIICMINMPKIKCCSAGPMYWFNKYFIFFILLLFLSCDCYLCIILIKSHIFGMNLFNSGHTSIELKQVRCTKIATILTQNISQISIQLIFALVVLHKFNLIIIISICLSIILSIPFIFLWFLGSANNRLSFCKQYVIDVTLIAPKYNNAGINNDIHHQSSMINRYSGYKRILHQTLCEILGVNTSKLEIGFIDNIDGYKIHIIHKVASMDRDITKLYDGKYEILGHALKQIYHISLEWKIFVALTVFDKCENMQMTAENMQNMQDAEKENAKFHELPQQTPISDMDKTENDDNILKTEQNTVTSDGENDFQQEEEITLDPMSSLQNNVGSMVLLSQQIPMQQINENIIESDNRDRLDTEVSDIFGVGGNDDDNPFEVQIVMDDNENNNNHNDGNLMLINHMEYEDDGSTSD